MITYLVIGVLLQIVLHANAVGNLNCSDYSLDPYAPSPTFAYKWFEPGTTGNTWNASKVYCEAICPTCQLAISRFKYSNHFLYQLTMSGRSQKNYNDPVRANWIGLRVVNGTWKWIDGQTCYPNDPSDQRCFNATFFGGDSNYSCCLSGLPSNAQTFQNSFWFDDADEAYGDGSMLCEIPGKFQMDVSKALTLL
jgi:hypothetical protein